MRNKILLVLKTSTYFLMALVAVVINSIASEWSWRDIKAGVTTEEEMLSLGGVPDRVILQAEDYFLIKNGVQNKPGGSYEFAYTIHSLFGIPKETRPIFKGPLQLSDDIYEIEFKATFYKGKLFGCSYNFKFKSNPEKKKYIEIFNSLLGEPISIQETSILGRELRYKNGYSVFFRRELEDSIMFLLPVSTTTK
jgi:hypothetical protein